MLADALKLYMAAGKNAAIFHQSISRLAGLWWDLPVVSPADLGFGVFIWFSAVFSSVLFILFCIKILE